MDLDNRMLVLPHRRKRRTQQQQCQRRRSPESTPRRRPLMLALLLLTVSRSASTVRSFTSPVASPVPPRQELSRRRRQQLQEPRTAVRSSSSLRLHLKSPPASPARVGEGEILLRRRRRLLILSMRNAGTGNDGEFLGYDDHNRDDDSAYGGAAGDGSSNDGDCDPYHDRRPRRRTVLKSAEEMPVHPIHPIHGPQWTWNVHHPPSTKLRPTFPATVDEVTDDIVEALETAWAHHNRHSTGDSWGSDGRIGIEIDGARALQLGRPSDRATRWSSDGQALRAVALQLAIKLCKGNRHTAPASAIVESTHCRPVAVYLNTIQQTLRANGELRSLLMDDDGSSSSYDDNCNDDESTSSTMTSITLHCLTQDPTLPVSMMEWNRNPNKVKKRRKSSASPSAPFPEVDASRGVVIVVQPSDYNHEHRPPGPTLGAAEALQKLCARAALEGVPVVVLSPRFGGRSDDEFALMGTSNRASSSDTATALPWILRDFVPPVYSWVALNPSSSSGMVMKGVVEHHSPPPMHAKTETMLDNDEDTSSRRWNPTLTWHMFARQPDRGPRRRPAASESASSAPMMRHRYTYLASASYVPVTAAGPSSSQSTSLSTLLPPPPPHRPPSPLLQRVWEEFGTVVVVNQ